MEMPKMMDPNTIGQKIKGILPKDPSALRWDTDTSKIQNKAMPLKKMGVLKNAVKKTLPLSSGFASTKAAGSLSPTLKSKLQKEAPETLSAPKSDAFASQDSYKGALSKFKKFGNWASSE